jgi:hypothetical protein
MRKFRWPTLHEQVATGPTPLRFTVVKSRATGRWLVWTGYGFAVEGSFENQLEAFKVAYADAVSAGVESVPYEAPS